MVRSFSAAVSLGQNPTRFNRGRFSKVRNRRNGFGQPFGYVFEILTEEQEAEVIMKKMEKTAKVKKAPTAPPEPTDLASPDQNPPNPENP